MLPVADAKIGAIVPMRMAASRLPGKPLLDISGKTTLERVADRARACRYVERIGLATTTAPGDDALAQHATQLGLLVYRGSEEDVLRRITEAAHAFELTTIVEVDGDDLLCSSEHMERCVDIALATGADLVSFTNLPVGATPNVLRRAALDRALVEKPYDNTSTGFFRFILESGRFQVERATDSDPRHHHSAARMTLDYPADLEFFRAVYRLLDARPRWTFADLVALFVAAPELIAINKELKETYEAHFRAGIVK